MRSFAAAAHRCTSFGLQPCLSVFLSRAQMLRSRYDRHISYESPHGICCAHDYTKLEDCIIRWSGRMKDPPTPSSRQWACTAYNANFNRGISFSELALRIQCCQNGCLLV